jgi:hypothetical protein
MHKNCEPLPHYAAAAAPTLTGLRCLTRRWWVRVEMFLYAMPQNWQRNAFTELCVGRWWCSSELDTKPCTANRR